MLRSHTLSVSSSLMSYVVCMAMISNRISERLTSAQHPFPAGKYGRSGPIQPREHNSSPWCLPWSLTFPLPPLDSHLAGRLNAPKWKRQPAALAAIAASAETLTLIPLMSPIWFPMPSPQHPVSDPLHP